MSTQDTVRQMLIGTGVQYLNIGFGVITDVDKNTVHVEFDSGIRTFLRDIFAKSAKIEEADAARRLQLQLALEHNMVVPEKMLPLLDSILQLFSLEVSEEDTIETDGLSIFLLALEEWNEDEEPVINTGSLTFSEDEDSLLFEYTILFMMDEEKVFEVYEDEGSLLEYIGRLLRGLGEITALHDPDADIYCCFLEEYDHYFREDYLPDDGMYLGLRVSKWVQTARELEIIARFIEMFIKKCDFFITQFATQPLLSADDCRDDSEDFEEEDEDKDLNDARLTYQDFVIISNRRGCISKNHDMEKVVALLSFVLPGGKVEERQLPAFHCRDCNEYYLHEYDFQKAKQGGGILLCRMVYEKEYFSQNRSGFANLNEESPLKICGYNVNKSEGLSELQRRTILDKVIEDGVMDYMSVKSHIAWLVRERRKFQNMEEAINKWEADLAYLRKAYHEDSTRIRVSSVTTKQYEPW